MGCFKPTKFIQLSDTPETYEGQAGKIVKVNEEENAVIFSDADGCEICPPVPGEGDAGKVITVNPRVQDMSSLKVGVVVLIVMTF